MTSRNHAKTDTAWEQEFQRRHLEMMAATIAAGLDLETNNILDPGSQVERGAALAVRAARAIQEEVRKDG